MPVLSNILGNLPDGKLTRICIGLHWTYVEVEVEGRLQIGLASTLEGAHDHGSPSLSEAGNLLTFTALGLARKILTAKGPMASIAMATINALLPRHPQQWVDINAEEVIAQRGVGKTVVLVGRFPFTDRLRQRVGHLDVIERHPQEGDFSPEAAPQVIPKAEVVAITSMTFTNGSLEGLLELCRPESLVVLLGPTTPLSPLLFEHGVDILAGAIVEKPEPVIRVLQEGGNFRQLHRAGVRLVTMRRETLEA
jgi:uncharacterized protein (DUF4213/DUF364 family)